MDIDRNSIKFREVTALDKQDVLSLRDSAEAFMDSLPALFDYYASIPNAYLAGVFYDENLAGFLVGHIGNYICFCRFFYHFIMFTRKMLQHIPYN